ncbi:MAG: FtsQ-type POTRA domain-containing protein [Pseudomonadota bacterium]
MIDSKTPSVRYGWIFSIAVIMILLLLGLFLADRLYQPEQFRISQIEVRGKLNRVEGAQIKSVVESVIDGNYFSISLARLEQEIESQPWVFSASLRRRWPSTLLVDVVEIEPIALWGGDRWLNFSGDLVEQQASRVSGLPLLDGPESRQLEIWSNFKQWSARLIRNGIKLNALTLDERGLWTLRISLSVLGQEQLEKSLMAEGIADDPDSGGIAPPDLDGHQIGIVVPADSADKRLNQFIEALNDHLMLDFANIETIDLRYPNGFAVGWLANSGRENISETFSNDG